MIEIKKQEDIRYPKRNSWVIPGMFYEKKKKKKYHHLGNYVP